MTANNSFEPSTCTGMALDPIHVGAGGTRLGRVDNTIVRDPVTNIPKIPGSSLAGVMRAYVAMKKENESPDRQIDGKPKPYYPDCAGLGQSEHGGAGGHCGKPYCPVCTVFGFASGKDSGGGFAGLAGFSDMHVLLFPVASRLGPQWVSSPGAMRLAGVDISTNDENVIYQESVSQSHINLGWLMLPVSKYDGWERLKTKLDELDVHKYIKNKVLLVSDKLFTHIVNSNLEVRTSVAISPATGAAEEGALFTYEALPRGTVMIWELTCRNPNHFKINGDDVTAVKSPGEVRDVVGSAHSYLEHLGIGGMGSRGMGRVRVFHPEKSARGEKPEKEARNEAASL